MYAVDDWKREEFWYTKLEHGKWELVLPANPDGSCRIQHNSCIKVNICSTFPHLSSENAKELQFSLYGLIL